MFGRRRAVGPRSETVRDRDDQIWTGFELGSRFDPNPHIRAASSDELNRTGIKHLACNMRLRVAGDHGDRGVHSFNDLTSLSESVVHLRLTYAATGIDHDGHMRTE